MPRHGYLGELRLLFQGSFREGGGGWSPPLPPPSGAEVLEVPKSSKKAFFGLN